jgi:hypothetical protein
MEKIQTGARISATATVKPLLLGAIGITEDNTTTITAINGGGRAHVQPHLPTLTTHHP